MSETSVKIIKNEIRCRDDTVPKTVDTRSHCKHISFLHLFHSYFPNREHRGLPSLALRMVFLPSTDGYLRISLARILYNIYAHALDLSAKIRMREIRTRDSYWRPIIAETSQSRLLKGTYCLFASKDHVRPVSKRLCIIFMACSCPNFVLGH